MVEGGKKLVHRHFQFGILILSLCVLGSWVWILKDTPFRGEHWAMLYVVAKSPSFWQKVVRLANFEVFGDHRFQPFNTLPMLLGYLGGGLHFAFHYFVSVVLHLGFVTASMHWLFFLRHNRRGSFKEVITKLPLEHALFLVLFVACDVITWSYFQYIQIASTLAVTSTFLFFSAGGRKREEHFALALLLFAILTYEPFVVLLLLFVGARLLEGRKAWKEVVVPGMALLFFMSRYWGAPLGEAITSPPNVSVLNGIRLFTGHDALFEAPYAFNKIVFVIYNFVIAWWNLCLSLLWPTEAHKTNIYELPNLQAEFRSALPYVSAITLGVIVFLGAALTWRRKQLGSVYHQYLFSALGLVGMFTVLCLGRPEAGHYSAVQFRYAFILAPFLLVPLLDLAWRLTPLNRTVIYPTVLVVLFGFNMASSLNQVWRLRTDMSKLSQYVGSLREKKISDKEMVIRTAQTLHDYRLQVPGDDVFLIYNGRGALTRFVGKL